jgi:hypothetical protein
VASDGTVSGTVTSIGYYPSEPGYQFQYSVSDSTGFTLDSFSFLYVAPTPLSAASSLSNGSLNVPYSQSLRISGGSGLSSDTPPSYSVSVTSGHLPDGLGIGSFIAGYPRRTGIFTFTLAITDESNSTITPTYTVTIGSPPLSIAFPYPPAANVGTNYIYSLTANGQPPYTWSLTEGSLPPGLVLNANGTLSGTPTTTGEYLTTVQVTDATQTTASTALSMIVQLGQLSVAPLVLPGATSGALYYTPVSITGGTPPYLINVVSANPSQFPEVSPINTQSTFSIFGSPGTPGVYPVPLTVTDSLGQVLSTTLTITVSPSLQVAPGQPGSGIVGQPYSATLSASGGTQPYNWSVISGGLPPGITLSPTGTLLGTPLASGSYSAGLLVADAAGYSVTDAVSMAVSSAVSSGSFTISPATLAFDNTTSTQSLTVIANEPAFSWSASSGAPWISLGSTSGSGTSTLGVSVAANPSGSVRDGSVFVDGATIPVQQWSTTQVFSDVPPSEYYFDAVNLLKQKAITSGCGPTTYCPASDITRAQMAVFLVRSVIGSDNFTYTLTPYFTDVPATAFGFPWIQKLRDLNITEGCATNLFCPDDPVTRAQMAVFVIRARYGASASVGSYPYPYFTDVPEGSFGFAYIQRMYQDHITNGCGPGLFCPNNPVTRGDMALFLMRGAFNELLPPGTPVISQVSPTTVTPGQTINLTITGVNTTFLSGGTFGSVPGISATAYDYLDLSTIVVTLTVDASVPAGPVSVWVTDATGYLDVIPNGLLVQ